MTLPTPPTARRKVTALLALIAAATLGPAAWADDDKSSSRAPLLPKFQQECGACHAPYAPGLLPAASWQRVMGGLGKHYGTDASLDAATTGELTTWLLANAGTGKRGREAPPEDRITRAAWFTREHREVSAATWRLPAVKSASNCAACHTQADQGTYRERDIRIPR
jgi:mono/diheme cytochrome c family protein